MIIYTGRFQPFHNGHLDLIKSLKLEYPNERICLAIIKDVPINKKTMFDEAVDSMLVKTRNPFNSEVTLALIREALHDEGLEDVLVTLMPRASCETWSLITALFDCERTWVFTENQLGKDEWEDKKYEFYKSRGDKVVRVPIKKNFSGSLIREYIEAKNFGALKTLLPECVLNYMMNN